MRYLTHAMSFAVLVSGFAFLVIRSRGGDWMSGVFGGLVGVLLWIVFTGQLGDWRDLLYPRGPNETQEPDE